MRKGKKLSSEIKKLFQKKNPGNSPAKNSQQTKSEQEEVKKRLRALGYFDE